MQGKNEISECVQTETYRGVVYPWCIDHMGHMNVQFYTARFDEASWQFLAKFGLTPNYLRQNARGLVALEQNAKYFVEVLSGCLLEIRTVLVEFKNKTVRFRHCMYNSETNEKLANMELLVAYIDTNVRKTVPLPDFVHDKSNAMLGALSNPHTAES